MKEKKRRSPAPEENLLPIGGKGSVPLSPDAGNHRRKAVAMALWTAGLFLGFWGVYVLYCLPSIYWGDSGELITGAYTLGNVHPSGYPLYLLLGRMGLSIPVDGRNMLEYFIGMSGLPFRMNLMSVFFSGITVALVFSILRRMVKNGPIAIIGACCFALARTFWSKALLSEVYSLTELLFALNLYFFVVLTDRNDRRLGILWFFTLGVSAFVHHMLMAFIPLYFIYIFVLNGRQRLKRVWLPCFIFFMFLGAMVYAYLPLRSAAAPALNWWKPDTILNFVKDLLYGGYAYGAPVWKTILSRIKNIDIVGEFGWPALAAMILGLLGLFSRRRQFRIWMFYVAAGSFVAVAMIEHGEPEVFKLPPLFLLALGFGFFAERFYSFVKSTKFSPRFMGFMAISILIAIGVVLPFMDHDRTVDQRYNEWPYLYGRAILESMPLDGETVLVVSGSQADFPVLFLQEVEGARRDVRVIPLAFLAMNWKREQLRDKYGALRRTPDAYDPNCRIPVARKFQDPREPWCVMSSDVGKMLPARDCCVYQFPLSIPSEGELKDLLSSPDKLGVQFGTVWFLSQLIKRNMPPSVSAPINRRFFFSEYNELVSGMSLGGEQGVVSNYFLLPIGNLFQMLTPNLRQFVLPNGRPYKLEDAADIFAAAELPKDPYTRFVIGSLETERCKALIRLVRITEAQQTCNMALKHLEGDDPEVRRASADALGNLGVITRFMGGNWRSAADVMRDRARFTGAPQPSPVQTLSRVVDTYLRTGELPEPTAPSLIAMGRAMSRSSVLRIEAAEYDRLAMDSAGEAEKYFGRALKADPNNAFVYYEISLLENDRGDYQASARAARQAINADPGFVKAYANFGSALAQMNQYQDAELAYKKALELDPAYYQAMANLARLYIKMGKGSDALLYLDKAEHLAQGDPGIRLLIGQIYLDLYNEITASPQFLQRSMENCIGVLQIVRDTLGIQAINSHPLAIGAQECFLKAKEEIIKLRRK